MHLAVILPDTRRYPEMEAESLVSGKFDKTGFVLSYGNKHASLNSGYPESALAGVPGCRFGGPGHYSGIKVLKPYIRITDKTPVNMDLNLSLTINRRCELYILFLVSFTFIIPVLFKFCL